MNVPASSTIFVGRDAELGEIARLLTDPACRLLTLVGPGGIGKTRLAVEAARSFPGAYFVPLQPLTSPDFIVAAVADAVGFQFYSGVDPKQQLLDYLREKSLLLVLDNFEHLLDGAALLSEMLAAAPALHLLVTSRERLNLVEEWTQEVGGLAYPQTDGDGDGYSAVDLFVQQARHVKVGFALTDQNRTAVVRVCQLVGGMPLAIELAASWVRALSCEAIADEIGLSLDILETSARNVEPRHRTMRAAFEPTWERLTDHERAVFMRLSVFRGGFTREAAKEVAGASLRTLTALVDKCLLRLDANGRYDVHELLRQYATEKLSEAGEVRAVADRHLDYFVTLAEQAEAHQYGPEQGAWLDHLDIELDNIRAALLWSLDDGTAASGLRIAVSMHEFWDFRGYPQEGLVWLEGLLAAAQDASPSLRTKALYCAGELAESLTPLLRHAGALCTEALDLARQIGDPQILAWALSAYAMSSQPPRGWSVANIPLMDESLAMFRELDDPYGLSHALRRRALLAIGMKDYTYARTLVEESLTRDRAVGAKNAMAWSLQILGDALIREGHSPGPTAALFEESLTLFRELGERGGIQNSLGTLGRLEQLAGHDTRAQSLYKEALALMIDIGWTLGDMLRYSLAGLGIMLEAQGNLEEAARLLAAAQFLGWFDLPLFPKTIYDAHLASVRTRLSEAAFAVASAEGKAMTWKQAATYALQQAKLLREIPEGVSVNHHSPTNLLSVRELEILRLMADGLSNGEIAEQLVLARSTIKWYVRQIFSKLDATNRTQAVAHARTQGWLS